MKILQINAVYGYSSTGVIARDIYNEITITGDEAMVFCMNSNTHDSDIYKIGGGIDGKMHALLTRLLGLQGCWSNISTKRIIRGIRKIDPDIVHIHNLHSNFINLPQLLKYCYENSKPLVVTLHDCWYFTGKCYHFEDAGCMKWKSGCAKCPKRRIDIPSLLCDSSSLAYSIKKAAFNKISNLYVVGCSRWITDLARQSPIFATAKFATIINGVDTLVFNYRERVKSSKPYFTIMVMANKWFLHENDRLRARIKDILSPNRRLKVIGCSRRQLDENLDTELIKYVGFTKDREELAEYYRQADLFLNVTFIDTLPTVNMESICCGTPVVTYRSGGSPELIEDGITGYVVEQNDIEGILAAVKRIESGIIDRRKCAEIGKMRFDKNSNYKKYINLYKQIYSNK